MKVAVKVMPKNEVLDSQGRAVLQVLQQEGDLSFKQCRVGKYIYLEIESTNKEDVVKKLSTEGANVLFNPLIEQIEVEVL